MATNVLVTGATGFVGSHLVRHFVARGCAVTVIVRPSSDLSSIESVSDSLNVEVHDGSTRCMSDILDRSQPDLVVHLAARVLDTHSANDISQLIEGNVLFLTQLAEAMTNVGCEKLINTGTSWQHFNNDDYNPVCLYAATKQAAEAILDFYVRVRGLNVITLKLFDTYGPNDTRLKLFSFLNRALSADLPVAMSPGEQLLDLVHIDDVIRGYMIAADRLSTATGVGHESYALSSGSPMRLRDIVRIVEEVTGESLRVEWGGRPYRNREVMVPWNAGAALPGWTPKVGLADGVQQMAPFTPIGSPRFNRQTS